MVRLMDYRTSVQGTGTADPNTELVTVGTCPRCGVSFLGRSDHRGAVGEALRVHFIICPGGDRAGEWAAPFEATAGESSDRRVLEGNGNRG
jgi:hypothetical protein